MTSFLCRASRIVGFTVALGGSALALDMEGWKITGLFFLLGLLAASIATRHLPDWEESSADTIRIPWPRFRR